MKTTRRLALAFIVLAIAGYSGIAQAASFTKYDAAAFNKSLASGQAAIVHVHAEWCITCKRQMKPLGAELSKPAFNKVAAYRVDFDNDRDFLRKYRISSQSTILVFKNGKLINKAVGITDPDAIAGVVRTAL